MIQLVALVAVVALIFAVFALLRQMAPAGGARTVRREPSPPAAVRGTGGVVVPVPALVAVPAAFLIDPVLGLVSTGVLALVALKGAGTGSFLASRRTPAATNVAFAQWRRDEEERIARLREVLDEAEADFATHLEQRRAEEDRREFEAFKASGGLSGAGSSDPARI